MKLIFDELRSSIFRNYIERTDELCTMPPSFYEVLDNFKKLKKKPLSQQTRSLIVEVTIDDFTKRTNPITQLKNSKKKNSMKILFYRKRTGLRGKHSSEGTHKICKYK